MPRTTIIPAATVNPAAEAASNYTPGIGELGFSTNDIFTDDLAEAENTAQQIQKMGGTAVRIFYILNKNTAWENYRERTCNAFQAAHDHDLQPIVTFVGYDEDGRGYMPTSKKEVKQFITTASSIIWTVASNKGPGRPGGCVPDQKHFIIEGPNEPNNDLFNRGLNTQTPVTSLATDIKASQALKNEAARPEIGATVEYGESLAVGNRDITSYLQQQDQALEESEQPNPYDFVDEHPYPKNPIDDPSQTMRNLKTSFNSLNNFKKTQLVFGEYAVNTINPPAAEANGYNPPVSSTVGVSEATQVKFISNFLKVAAEMDTPWVTLFNVQDDGGGQMSSSGEYYVDGTPKSSQPAIRYQIGKYTGR